MSNAMSNQCVYARIEQENFQLASGGRIAGLVGPQQFTQSIGHEIRILLPYHGNAGGETMVEGAT
jgi:hypothetical protein